MVPKHGPNSSTDPVTSKTSSDPRGHDCYFKSGQGIDLNWWFQLLHSKTTKPEKLS